MKVREKRDLGSGMLFLGFGVAGILLSPSYQMGTAARMGPGYFPFLVSLSLAAVGLVLSLRSLRASCALKAESTPGLRLRPLVLVLGSVFLFGLLLRPMGLLLPSFILVFISSMAHRKWRPRESLAIAAVLSMLVIALFVYALGMPLAVWPSLSVRGG
jgi:hypothetical protein